MKIKIKKLTDLDDMDLQVVQKNRKIDQYNLRSTYKQILNHLDDMCLHYDNYFKSRI
jgi:hypothetical protein